MPDPLSVAASIIAVVQLSGMVIRYLNDVKGAPRERQRILSEVSSISGILYHLQDYAEEGEGSWSPTLITLKSPNGPLEQFKLALEQLASKLAPVDGWKKTGQAFRWPFREPEIQKILLTIERQKSLFILAVENDNTRLLQAIKEQNRGLERKVEEVGKSVTQQQIIQKRQQILEWLPERESYIQQSEVIRHREEGTGLWFIESEKFNEWLNGTQKTLFCPGILGAGKTMLASIVIDHLQQTIQDESRVILYLFCSYENKQDGLEKLLASLLKQLLQKGSTTSDDLKRLYDKCVRNDTGPTAENLFGMLLSEISRYSQVYIIVDALNELSDTEGTRQLLLSNLRGLQSAKKVNLMVTSVFIPEIETEFEQDVQLRIRANNGDLKSYLEGQMFRLPSFAKGNTSLQDTIRSEIITAVDGMFLLARLHLNSLVGKTSIKAIKIALKNLPKGENALDDTYRDNMKRIQNQSPDFQNLAQKALCWITYAEESLTACELLHALAVEPGEPDLDPDNVSNVNTLISACAGLVTVDGETQIVRFIHHSTQQYFQRISKESFPDAQRNVAETCLTYLSFDVFGTGPCDSDEMLESRLEQYHLLNYAARHWGDHVRSLEDGGVQEELSLLLLEDDSKRASLVQIWHVSYTPKTRRKQRFQRYPRDLSGIHVAVAFRLERIVKLLLEMGKDKNMKDRAGLTPLVWAVNSGSESMTELLLARGADRHVADPKGWLPIHYAAQNSSLLLIQLLCKEETDFEAKTNRRETPLLLAVSKGNPSIVQYLFENGADVNSADQQGRTALHIASVKGYKDIVDILCEKADMTLIDTERCTPLDRAVKNGHRDVIEVLWRASSGKPNHDDLGQKYLFRAAGQGDMGMVEFWLQHKVDVNSRNRESKRTALHHAGMNDRKEVSIMLLERGIDPNAQDMNGASAIHLAAQWKREDFVTSLVHYGKYDPLLVDDRKRTLLHWIAKRGWTHLVKVLIASGSDPKAQDYKGRTSLEIATLYNQRGCAEVLAENTEVLSIPDNDGWLASDWAQWLGLESLTSILAKPGSGIPSRTTLIRQRITIGISQILNEKPGMGISDDECLRYLGMSAIFLDRVDVGIRILQDHYTRYPSWICNFCNKPRTRTPTRAFCSVDYDVDACDTCIKQAKNLCHEGAKFVTVSLGADTAGNLSAAPWISELREALKTPSRVEIGPS